MPKQRTSKRATRQPTSSAKAPPASNPATRAHNPTLHPPPQQNHPSQTPHPITLLPRTLKPTQKHLPPTTLPLLLTKQLKLHALTPSLILSHPTHAPAISATLLFAHEQAGTAICIAPSGLLLTCAHCIAEEPSDLDLDETHWLLFAFGRIVAAKCTAWDARRDLALLQIVSAQAVSASDGTGSHGAPFPYVPVALAAPSICTPVFCVGQPGGEDLQAGGETGFEVLSVSEGRFWGYAPGDVQDNMEIGRLKHGCWTYWGHSGAGVFEGGGGLVGVHSSWEERTGGRRGVGIEAVGGLLGENGVGVDACVDGGDGE